MCDYKESEDEDDEDDEDEDMDDDEDEDEEEDVDMADEEPAKPAKITPSKRKKKQDEAYSEAGTESTASSSTAASSEIDYEEWEADTVATSIDDGLPHPRVKFLFFSFFPFSFLPPSTFPLFLPPSPFLFLFPLTQQHTHIRDPC